MSLLQNSNAIEAGGYPISNSLRFQSASSTYMSRTPASSSNRQIWTWSGWVKRGTIAASTDSPLFSSRPAAGTYTNFQFKSGASVDTLALQDSAGTSLITTQVFRDPSAWYHIVLAVDTTQATSTNRVKMYVNGSQITAFGTATYPTLNANLQINAAQAHSIGIDLFDTTAKFDGYLSEVNFVDGTQLTPSSFGETNALTGQWVAKKYTGTYGTNGFYLPFSNGTSTTTLGADSSGNGNNWTLTNFTRSAGVSDCWMKDVPSGNGGVSGTQPSSNYAVLNPLDKQSSATTQKSNLEVYSATADAQWKSIRSTMYSNSGKVYFEGTLVALGDSNWVVGLADESFTVGTSNSYAGSSALSYGLIGISTAIYAYNNSASTTMATGITQAAGDVFMVAIDYDAGKIWFGRNGTWYSSGNPSAGTNQIYTITANTRLAPTVSVYKNTNSTYVSLNCGQRSFAYTPPSGFKALCTANLPVATIVKGNQYMDATLWTGDNTNPRAITNTAGFKPDLVWVKSRSNAQQHVLNDSVRGAGTSKGLSSNTTDAEGSANILLYGATTAFNSNGFSVGGGTSNQAFVNYSPYTYVGWQWQAGQGTTSSNTNGSITSTVSVSTTAGFSVVTLTTQASGVGTYGHGLGVAPKMIIYKFRNVVGDWSTYHESLGNTKYIFLNTTGAAVTNSIWWNNTSPTSSVVTLGSAFAGSQPIVAYCFAEIAGFSKFGSYTGNGSADGPFVYCGFRPKFVMIKNTTTASTNWLTWDSTTNSYNVANLYLIPNSSVAEQTTGADIDVLSNGFKVRNTSGAGNTSSATIIFAAFAENPFAQANAR